MYPYPYKVQGIPCFIEHSEDHDSGFAILDTRFRPAEWLQDKMQERDVSEALAFLEKQERDEEEEWAASRALDI